MLFPGDKEKLEIIDKKRSGLLRGAFRDGMQKNGRFSYKEMAQPFNGRFSTFVTEYMSAGDLLTQVQGG